MQSLVKSILLLLLLLLSIFYNNYYHHYYAEPGGQAQRQLAHRSPQGEEPNTETQIMYYILYIIYNILNACRVLRSTFFFSLANFGRPIRNIVTV